MVVLVEETQVSGDCDRTMVVKEGDKKEDKALSKGKDVGIAQKPPDNNQVLLVLVRVKKFLRVRVHTRK